MDLLLVLTGNGKRKISSSLGMKVGMALKLKG